MVIKWKWINLLWHRGELIDWQGIQAKKIVSLNCDLDRELFTRPTAEAFKGGRQEKEGRSPFGKVPRLRQSRAAPSERCGTADDVDIDS